MIESNPTQPRKTFDKNSILELAQSIKENGLIQPIMVRPSPTGYALVAGERRFKAFQLLKRDTIPAIVAESSVNDSENLSLIENIQRMDLSAIEEALAYQSLIENQNLTQEQLANKIGKSQSAVANKLRLLQLSPEVIEAISDKQITERHGRSLLGVDEAKQKELLSKIKAQDLNVAQTEKLVNSIKDAKGSSRKAVIAKDSRILLGVNTINEAIDLVKTVGISVSSEESETEDFYQILIRLKK